MAETGEGASTKGGVTKRSVRRVSFRVIPVSCLPELFLVD